MIQINLAYEEALSQLRFPRQAGSDFPRERAAGGRAEASAGLGQLSAARQALMRVGHPQRGVELPFRRGAVPAGRGGKGGMYFGHRHTQQAGQLAIPDRLRERGGAAHQEPRPRFFWQSSK